MGFVIQQNLTQVFGKQATPWLTSADVRDTLFIKLTAKVIYGGRFAHAFGAFKGDKLGYCHDFSKYFDFFKSVNDTQKIAMSSIYPPSKPDTPPLPCYAQQGLG